VTTDIKVCCICSVIYTYIASQSRCVVLWF